LRSVTHPDAASVPQNDRQPIIVREVFDNGVRLITERMDHLRSVSIGVWLMRGSRHEPPEQSGIAHFIEHMLFKGTGSRSAEDIAQEIDSVGGHLDAFTAKEYASYFIKVLDEHLPFAWDILADIVRHPALRSDDIEREKKVILEEIKMVEDTPDDLVHELFTQALWTGHSLGRPILGEPGTVDAFDRGTLTTFFERTYVAPNLLVVAVGNVHHSHVRDLVGKAFGTLPSAPAAVADPAPGVVPHVQVRTKDLEQSHICLGVGSYPQNHDDRYTSYVLNTVLGGSMSSRLFQNVREKRGLAYAVFSGLAAYHDTGALTIYAGCANDAVREVIDVVVEEVRGIKATLPDPELRRAKDHLKGSLMLSLESTSSRMSNLARQEIYFDRQFSLDETLDGIERVSAADVRRVAEDLFVNGAMGATVVGPNNGWQLTAERLDLG
jgi:predicted Zn-dependent peptidase